MDKPGTEKQNTPTLSVTKTGVVIEQDDNRIEIGHVASFNLIIQLTKTLNLRKMALLMNFLTQRILKAIGD